jgi:hypothetical protein
MAPTGYVVLYASNGPGGYQASIGRVKADGLSDEFDSTKLNNGDMFVVTLMRPGTYVVSDTMTGATMNVTVSYPPEPDGPFIQPEPAEIKVTAGFDQQNLTVLPTQGLVFKIMSNGHAVTVTLNTPNDGPGAQTIRWTNPDTL